MGGIGSGGHNHSGRAVVESCWRLDATLLRRKGMFADGVVGQITWNAGEADEASIEIRGGATTLSLAYSWREGEGAWRPVCEVLATEWRPRHMGGQEAYFVCPGCNRRAKRLYLRGHLFRCRTCHRLVYASSREQTGNRATRKMRKLRRRMDSPEGLEDVINRPKGMHRATFDRMVDRILAAENEVWDDSLRLLGRLRRSETKIRQVTARRDFWA